MSMFSQSSTPEQRHQALLWNKSFPPAPAFQKEKKTLQVDDQKDRWVKNRTEKIVVFEKTICMKLVS